MKVENLLALAVIAAGMLFASVFVLPEQEQRAPARLGESIASADAATNASFSAIPEDLYFTNNGMVVRHGVIESETDAAATLSLVSEDKTLLFNVSIQANKSFTYLQLDGILVVPKESAWINPSETSFYSEGNELVISFATPVRELSVYTGRKGRPGFVVPDTGIEWRYDEEDRMLSIRGPLPNKLYIFWDDYKLTTFVEDTERLESLKAGISTHRAARPDLRNSIKERNVVLDGLRKDLGILHDEVMQRRADIVSLESRYGDLKSRTAEANANLTPLGDAVKEAEQNVSALDSRITANVLFEPRAVAIALIIGFIALMLIADALFFIPKVKK